MTKMVERRLVNCPMRHVAVYIVKYDDESFSVKCVLLKTCNDSCPYLKDPYYKSAYKGAPEYKDK